MTQVISERALQLSVQPAALKQLSTLAPQSLAALSQALSSGRVLDVVISQNKKSGQRGFYLFGQFIPASVPESVRDGERLNLKVSDVGETIVLKIIGSNEDSIEGSYVNTGEPLLEQSTLRQLRGIVNHSPHSLDLTALKDTATDSTRSEVSILAKQLLNALETLSEDTHVIDSAVAKDPHALEDALQRILSMKPPINPAEAKREKEKMERLKHDIERSILHTKSSIISKEDEKALEKIAAAAEAVTSLANLATNRHLIRGLNIISAELGNSAIVFMPAMVSQQLSLWKVELEAPRHRDVLPSNGESDNSQAGQELHLFLSFSSIGAVRVDLAFRSDKLITTLNFTNSEVCKFVDSKLKSFCEVMRVIGFKNTSAKCVAGDVQEIIPAWLRNLTSLSVSS